MTLRKMILLLFILCPTITLADTLAKYAAIAKNIPTMEMKADQQSQAWARSARSVLAVTDEAIAQSIVAMNKIAEKNGGPLICVPPETTLDRDIVHNILAKRIQAMQPDDANLTISQVVIGELSDQYPCNRMARRGITIPPITIQKIHHVQR